MTTSIQANAARRAAIAVSSSTCSKIKVVKEFTQEELIIEALQDTESENERWILTWKRILDEEEQAELEKKLLRQNASKGRVICKTYSRKGCFNTIIFPDMDFVPKLFTVTDVSKNEKMIEQSKKSNFCVIIGKVARYKDPKTMKGYYDLASFKVLRKRFEPGECLEGPVKHMKSPFPTLLTSTNYSNTSPVKVPLPDLLNSLGCSPTNHLLEDCISSSLFESYSVDHELKAPIKITSPTHFFPYDDRRPCSSNENIFTIGKMMKPKSVDAVPCKLEGVSASIISSQNREHNSCLNSHKSSNLKKTKYDGEHDKRSNSFAPIAESHSSEIKNGVSVKLPLNPCKTSKAGHANCGGESSSASKIILVKLSNLCT